MPSTSFLKSWIYSFSAGNAKVEWAGRIIRDDKRGAINFKRRYSAHSALSELTSLYGLIGVVTP